MFLVVLFKEHTKEIGYQYHGPYEKEDSAREACNKLNESKPVGYRFIFQEFSKEKV